MNQALQALEPSIMSVGLYKTAAQSLGHVAQRWGLEIPFLDIRDVDSQTCFDTLCDPRDLPIERHADMVIAVVGVKLFRRLTCRISGLSLRYPPVARTAAGFAIE